MNGPTADDFRAYGKEPPAKEEPAAEAEAAASAVWRTLMDLDDTPPGPLLLGMLEPGPNLLYGAPGIGKGMTGAWVITELQRMGMRVGIYDAEARPREWARRVEGLGGDRSQVPYIGAKELGSAAGRPIWDAIGVIGGIVRAAGIDVLLVDSIMPATGLGEERLKSDPQVPYMFVAALDSLDIPTLTFGHSPKNQPTGDPYGSMSWTAAMRLTWNGTLAEGEGHRIRWRPRKRNERGHLSGVLLDVSYGPDGRPCGVVRSDDEEDTRERLLLALKDGPRSVADLVEELLEDEESVGAELLDRTKERVGRMLRRMAKDGNVQREGPAGGPNVKWGLRWEQPR